MENELPTLDQLAKEGRTWYNSMLIVLQQGRGPGWVQFYNLKWQDVNNQIRNGRYRYVKQEC